MWYVIQAKSGDELRLKELLEATLDHAYYRECFVPLYEAVRRRQGKCLIKILKLFPGYLFIDTDMPVEVDRALKAMPDFATVLGTRDEADSEKIFLPITKDDADFLDSITEDGIMHVSYVSLSKTNRIEKVIGPLEKYQRFITKMEYRHRYAIVETDAFGKRRKISFGLWSDSDPRMPWLEEEKAKRNVGRMASDAKLPAYDIGIYVGNKVRYPEIYGDTVFTVDKVDPSHRIIHSTIDIFGSRRQIEMYADDVVKIG